MNLQPVTLTGNLVRLEPLGEIHAPDLLVAAAHNEIWTYLDEPTPRTIEDVLAFIAEALKEQEEGVRIPFAIIDNESGRVVGSTSYIDIRPKDRGVELGWAWLTPSRWDTDLHRRDFLDAPSCVRGTRHNSCSHESGRPKHSLAASNERHGSDTGGRVPQASHSQQRLPAVASTTALLTPNGQRSGIALKSEAGKDPT